MYLNLNVGIGITPYYDNQVDDKVSNQIIQFLQLRGTAMGRKKMKVYSITSVSAKGPTCSVVVIRTPAPISQLRVFR